MPPSSRGCLLINSGSESLNPKEDLGKSLRVSSPFLDRTIDSKLIDFVIFSKISRLLLNKLSRLDFSKELAFSVIADKVDELTLIVLTGCPIRSNTSFFHLTIFPELP
eukprot:NODE_17_length_48642_cov_1.199349.p42 type:complete len:108 gc:universal NODE_17_length_48642_cov_1.199349:14059-13736(-)